MRAQPYRRAMHTHDTAAPRTLGPRDSVDQAIERHVRHHQPQYVDALRELCRWPSVSAEDRQLPETAHAVSDVMAGLGIDARVMPTTPAGAPAVVAPLAGAAERRLLLYNHYDVQPVDPLHEWVTPPFEPTERNGRLFARGASDDKGDLLVRLAAVEALRAVTGTLPLPITFLVEGQGGDRRSSDRRLHTRQRQAARV